MKMIQIIVQLTSQTHNNDELVYVQYLEDISKATFTNPSNLSTPLSSLKPYINIFIPYWLSNAFNIHQTETPCCINE